MTTNNSINLGDGLRDNPSYIPAWAPDQAKESSFLSIRSFWDLFYIIL